MKQAITAILTAIMLTACGGTVDNGPTPTCEDDDYRDAHLEECIGKEAYAEHKDRVIEEVHTSRDNHVNPSGDGDIVDCGVQVPTHICTEDDGAKCEWSAYRVDGEGSRYVSKCKCLSDIEIKDAKGSC